MIAMKAFSTKLSTFDSRELDMCFVILHAFYTCNDEVCVRFQWLVVMLMIYVQAFLYLLEEIPDVLASELYMGDKTWSCWIIYVHRISNVQTE